MSNGVLSWAIGGIDFSLPGNGGFECLQVTAWNRRVAESAFGTGVSLVLLVLGICMRSTSSSSSSPGGKTTSRHHYHYNEVARTFLLLTFAFVYGMEISYKLATKQLAFLLNPCHVISVLEIYLLAALPWAATSRLADGLFKCILHWFHGPLVALIFPVTNTRILPMESEVYWAQHILLVLVPLYLLLCTRGCYSAPQPLDFAWIALAYGIWGLFHWCVLQATAILTLANLGNMLCPAISDPFYGPDYRLHGVWHQFVATALMGTICAVVGKLRPAAVSAASTKAD